MAWTRTTSVGTDKRGWVCRNDMTLPQPAGEATLEGVLPNFPWRPQSAPLGTWCKDASNARDAPTWEVGWSINFVTGDAILKERKGRKWIVRKKSKGGMGRRMLDLSEG